MTSSAKKQNRNPTKWVPVLRGHACGSVADALAHRPFAFTYAENAFDGYAVGLAGVTAGGDDVLRIKADGLQLQILVLFLHLVLLIRPSHLSYDALH